MSTYVPPGMKMNVHVEGELTTREVDRIEEICLDPENQSIVFYRKIPVLLPGEIIHWMLSSEIPFIFMGLRE